MTPAASTPYRQRDGAPDRWRQAQPVKAYAAILCVLLPGGAAAQTSYDAVAHCIVKRMQPHYHAYPLIYAPPRREAQVLLWAYDARDRHGAGTGTEPIATFNIRETDGTLNADFKADAGFAHASQAQAALRSCLRWSR